MKKLKDLRIYQLDLLNIYVDRKSDQAHKFSMMELDYPSLGQTVD